MLMPPPSVAAKLFWNEQPVMVGSPESISIAPPTSVEPFVNRQFRIVGLLDCTRIAVPGKDIPGIKGVDPDPAKIVIPWRIDPDPSPLTKENARSYCPHRIEQVPGLLLADCTVM